MKPFMHDANINITFLVHLDVWPKNYCHTHGIVFCRQKINLGHHDNHEREDFHISYVHYLWKDLGHHTKMFYLVTLILKFDLCFKNFNLGDKFC